MLRKRSVRYLVEHKIVSACWFLMIFYPLGLIWQGFDITDHGHWISNYRLFHSEPDSITMALWLTFAIGGLVDVFSFGLGAVAFRLAFVFIAWGCCFLTWQLFRSKHDEKFVAMGLLGAVVLFSYQNACWINYDSLSSVFLLVSAFLYLRPESSLDRLSPFLSGFVAGCSFFVRLPDILIVALLLMIALVDDVRYARSNKCVTLRKSSCVLLGSLSGILVVGLVIYFLGYWVQFTEGIKDLLQVTVQASSDNSHSTSGLLSRIAKDVKIFCGFIMVFASVLFVVKLLRVAALNLVCWSVGFYFFLSMCDGDNLPYALASICVVVILESFIAGRVNWGKCRVILMSLGVAVCVCAGSGSGFYKAKNCFWMLFPLVFSLIGERIRDEGERRSVRLSVWMPACVLLLSIVLYAAYIGVMKPQRDIPNRLLLTARINHPDTRLIFTNSGRARMISEVIDYFAGQESEGKTLMCCGMTPAFHYLLRMKPVLGRPWPFTRPVSLFEDKLKNLEALPEYVIRPKYSTSSAYWPDKKEPRPLRWNDYRQKVAIVDSFLAERNYHIDWENDFFAVYVQSVNDL